MSFELLALKLFAHQFKNNVHYRKFCTLQNEFPGQVRHWDEIPAMPALAFKELVLATFPLKKCRRVFRSSGTTLAPPMRNGDRKSTRLNSSH